MSCSSASNLFYLPGSLLNKNVCYYHVKYSEVKIDYINPVWVFVAAPQLIQPSVAIETGLVFLSAPQLEKKKNVQNIHGCVSQLSVCLPYYACVWRGANTHPHMHSHTHAHLAFRLMHWVHFEVRKKIKAGPGGFKTYLNLFIYSYIQMFVLHLKQ